MTFCDELWIFSGEGSFRFYTDLVMFVLKTVAHLNAYALTLLWSWWGILWRLNAPILWDCKTPALFLDVIVDCIWNFFNVELIYGLLWSCIRHHNFFHRMIVLHFLWYWALGSSIPSQHLRAFNHLDPRRLQKLVFIEPGWIVQYISRLCNLSSFLKLFPKLTVSYWVNCISDFNEVFSHQLAHRFSLLQVAALWFLKGISHELLYLRCLLFVCLCSNFLRCGHLVSGLFMIVWAFLLINFLILTLINPYQKLICYAISSLFNLQIIFFLGQLYLTWLLGDLILLSFCL